MYGVCQPIKGTLLYEGVSVCALVTFQVIVLVHAVPFISNRVIRARSKREGRHE